MRETGPNMRSCQIMLLQSLIMSTGSKQCRNRMTRYAGMPANESCNLLLTYSPLFCIIGKTIRNENLDRCQ